MRELSVRHLRTLCPTRSDSMSVANGLYTPKVHHYFDTALSFVLFDTTAIETMKTTRLILLGTLFSQAAFAQTNGRHYLYTYDSAGNIISRVKALSRYGENADSDIDNTNNRQEDEGQITIKTDASWSEVQIEISGEIRQGDRLSIFTSEGLFVASFRIQSSKFTLNLSRFRKGTYLFRFSRNKRITESKIVKQS